MSEPRVLFWDVENTHTEVLTFPMFKANIDYRTIRQDWFMLCAAWKWQGKKGVHSVSLLDNPSRFKKDHTDDYHVIKTMRDVINEADAVVAHNGDAFDMKKFNTRLVYHGLDPVHNVVQIDTLKMARQKFRFTFNKLDYLGEFLGVGKKIHTGIELWLDCFNGDETALRKMVKYNKQDIVVLEGVYDKLAPFCPSKLNQNLFTKERVCPTCGGSHLNRHKRRLTRTGAMIQMQCQECGSYSSYPEGSKTKGMIR